MITATENVEPMHEITVSICCLTYNQCQTIERTIRSFLDQVTPFNIEIFIHDDASDDGTTEIIRGFQQSHPDIIQTLIQPQNLYSSGVSLYDIYTQIVFPRLKGKYLAICEGDDYWTDPLKLKKQVEFMESHPEVTVSFHYAGYTGDEPTDFNEHTRYFSNLIGNRNFFELKDLIAENFIPNCTVMYRNCLTEYPKLFTNCLFPDWPLHIVYATMGSIGKIGEQMAVHHKRRNGIWEGKPLDVRMEALFEFYIKLLAYIPPEYRSDVLKAFQRHANHYASPDLTTIFNTGYSLGQKTLQSSIDELQNTLDLIFQSKTWRTANALRILSERAFPQASPRRKTASLIYKISRKTLKSLSRHLFKTSVTANRWHEQRLRRIVNKPLKEQSPLVSVIIINYNYGQYLEEAISSVLKQTFRNFELLVVDGGSDDPETLRVLNKLHNQGIKVIPRNGRHYAGDNRNYGIHFAKGRYICCLDADDMLDPTYLEKTLFLLESCRYDVVYSWVQCFGTDHSIWETAAATWEIVSEQQNVTPVAAVFRKSAWKKVGGFRDFPIGEGHIPEDWEFWARLAGEGFCFGVIPEPLFCYRVHQNSVWQKNVTPHHEILSYIKTTNRKYDRRRYKRRRRRALMTTWEVEQPFRNMKVNDAHKRILVALPFMVVGGVDTLFLNVFAHLARDFEITFYTTVPFGDEFGDNTHKFKEITPRIFHLPRFLTTTAQQAQFIRYLIATQHYDCMFLAGSTLSYDVLPEIKQIAPHLPVIDFLFNESGHMENNRKHAALIDIHLVENEKISEVLIRTYGEELNRIRLIHNGVDVAKFSRKTLHHTIRQRYHLHEDRFFIVYLGRFSEEKHPLGMVHIAKLLNPNFSGCTYYSNKVDADFFD